MRSVQCQTDEYLSIGPDQAPLCDSITNIGNTLTAMLMNTTAGHVLFIRRWCVALRHFNAPEAARGFDGYWSAFSRSRVPGFNGIYESIHAALPALD